MSDVESRPKRTLIPRWAAIGIVVGAILGLVSHNMALVGAGLALGAGVGAALQVRQTRRARDANNG
jgi:hypothetical protein